VCREVCESVAGVPTHRHAHRVRAEDSTRVPPARSTRAAHLRCRAHSWVECPFFGEIWFLLGSGSNIHFVRADPPLRVAGCVSRRRYVAKEEDAVRCCPLLQLYRTYPCDSFERAYELIWVGGVVPVPARYQSFPGKPGLPQCCVAVVAAEERGRRPRGARLTPLRTPWLQTRRESTMRLSK
jgi:hypothetical protein